jgi:hypothetical protein
MVSLSHRVIGLFDLLLWRFLVYTQYAVIVFFRVKVAVENTERMFISSEKAETAPVEELSDHTQIISQLTLISMNWTIYRHKLAS